MPKSPKGEPKRLASRLKPCAACEKSMEPQLELCRQCQRKIVAISKTQKYQFGACIKSMLQAKGTEKRLRVLDKLLKGANQPNQKSLEACKEAQRAMRALKQDKQRLQARLAKLLSEKK